MEYSFLDLLNSDWHDWKGSGKSEDLLNREGWIEEFLLTWHLEIPMNGNEGLRSALIELRSLLSSVFFKVSEGDRIHSSDINQLNAFLRNSPYHKQIIINYENDSEPVSDMKKSDISALSSLRIESKPVRRDINWVLAKITESFINELSEHDPRRFKICANPDCRWFFLDESRGMTRNWCDSKMCGNLMKVRRFRERHRQE